MAGSSIQLYVFYHKLVSIEASIWVKFQKLTVSHINVDFFPFSYTLTLLIILCHKKVLMFVTCMYTCMDMIEYKMIKHLILEIIC